MLEVGKIRRMPPAQWNLSSSGDQPPGGRRPGTAVLFGLCHREYRLGQAYRLSLLLTFPCLLVTLSCNGTDAVLDSGASNPGTTARFGVHGEIPIQEGLALGADPGRQRQPPDDLAVLPGRCLRRLDRHGRLLP